MSTCPRRRGIAALALTCSLLAAPAAAADEDLPGLPGLEPRNARAAKQLKDQERALAIYSRAADRVRKARPSCKPKTPPAPGTLIDGTPQPALLERLAPLRRPAAPGDALTSPPAFGAVFSAYTRTVAGPLGLTVRLLPARLTGFAQAPPRGCDTAIAAEARKLARRRSAAVRRALSAVLKSVAADDAEAPQAGEPDPEGLILGIEGPDTEGSAIAGAVDAERFAEHGSTGWLVSMKGPSTGVGVVPDGVATVVLRWPKVVDFGPLYKPKRYAKAITRTFPVVDNVYAVRGPSRGLLASTVYRVTWKGPDGRTLRSFDAP